jgi:oligosaccharide repeat unit polymerase
MFSLANLPIPKRTFTAFFSLVAVLLLIVYRYTTLGVAKDQILTFSVFYLTGTFALVLSFIRFKKAINPISIYSIFIFLMAYSFIRLSDLQSGYSTNTIILLTSSAFFYLLSALFNYPYKPVRLFVLTSSLRILFLYAIVSGSFITFCIECILFGYLPVLHIFSSDVYSETNAKLVPFLHYFIVLLAFVPTWSFIFYKQKMITKAKFRFLLALSLFILVNYLSRQLYLLLGITFFLAYSYYNYVNTKALLRGAVIVVGLFMMIGYLKFNSDLGDTFSDFSRRLAGIENEHVTILESTLTEYSSKRFTALDKMVKYRDSINYYGKGAYTFRPIISFFLLEKLNVVKRKSELDSEVNVGTYAIDPYLDYGFLGVLILNCLYGFSAIRYFKQYNVSYPEAIIKFSIIIFCIFMGMFINYFNTMLIWLGIIFNKILLGGIKNNNKQS